MCGLINDPCWKLASSSTPISGFYGDSSDEDGFLVGWPAMGNTFTDEADDFLPPLCARDSWTPLLPAHSSGPGHFAYVFSFYFIPSTKMCSEGATNSSQYLI